MWRIGINVHKLLIIVPWLKGLDLSWIITVNSNSVHMLASIQLILMMYDLIWTGTHCDAASGMTGVRCRLPSTWRSFRCTRQTPTEYWGRESRETPGITRSSARTFSMLPSCRIDIIIMQRHVKKIYELTMMGNEWSKAASENLLENLFVVHVKWNFVHGIFVWYICME